MCLHTDLPQTRRACLTGCQLFYWKLTHAPLGENRVLLHNEGTEQRINSVSWPFMWRKILNEHQEFRFLRKLNGRAQLTGWRNGAAVWEKPHSINSSTYSFWNLFLEPRVFLFILALEFITLLRGKEGHRRPYQILVRSTKPREVCNRLQHHSHGH